jgi:multiple sugar transport system substrate-binding protein
MADQITLRGITWNHARGLDPLLASNEPYATVDPGFRVDWQTRSLAGFGEDPLIQLADRFDLLIIDHPFVGDAAASRAFVALDELADPAALADRRRSSVGPSHASYDYAGHQWALAIDAAAQVSAIHERLAERPMPVTWDEALALGSRLRADGRWMAVPMWPADLIVATYSIGRGLGFELFSDGRVFSPADGWRVLETLRRLCDLSHPDAIGWNPPTVLDRMRDGVVDYSPILFGYSNYSRQSSGGHVRFGNLPTASGMPTGSTLGGAGIAISARCAHPIEALAYALWITSAEVQTGIYVEAGGQPGRLEPWLDERVNAACGDFFRRTLATLEGAWVRPRVPGYQAFQGAGSAIVATYVAGGTSAKATLDGLDDAWRDTVREAAAIEARD